MFSSTSELGPFRVQTQCDLDLRYEQHETYLQHQRHETYLYQTKACSRRGMSSMQISVFTIKHKHLISNPRHIPTTTTTPILLSFHLLLLPLLHPRFPPRPTLHRPTHRLLHQILHFRRITHRHLRPSRKTPSAAPILLSIRTPRHHGRKLRHVEQFQTHQHLDNPPLARPDNQRHTSKDVLQRQWPPARKRRLVQCARSADDSTTTE